MKPPLSDTLVICDMDNTLLTAKEGIPACNRAVIQLYTGMGGLFTVACFSFTPKTRINNHAIQS